MKIWTAMNSYDLKNLVKPGFHIVVSDGDVSQQSIADPLLGHVPIAYDDMETRLKRANLF